MRLRLAKKVVKLGGDTRQRRRGLRRLYRHAGRRGPPDEHHAVDWGHGLQPANVYQWAYWFEDIHSRRVAHTQRGRRGVSTICLGLYHHPGWYESARFTVDDRGKTTYKPCARYDTRAEAQAGHARLVAELEAVQ